MNRWIKKGFGLALAACAGVIGTGYLKNTQFLMPSEYKEVKSIVNELAEHNDLGDREITFTVVPGSWVGWFAENLKLCNLFNKDKYQKTTTNVSFVAVRKNLELFTNVT